MSYVPMPTDPYSLSVKVISVPHAFVHSGETFRYTDAVTLGSGATQDYWIQTPASGPRMHMTMYADGTAVTSFALYEGTDRSGITTQTINNAYRDSTNASLASLKKGTSGGTTDGTLLLSYSSGASSAQAKSSFSVGHDAEWVLKMNTRYIFRITSGTAGNLCNVLFDWYEHLSGT